MRFFNNVTTLQDLRSQYKSLVFKIHPDTSGYESTEDMKLLNSEYFELSEKLAKGSKFYDSEMQFAQEFADKIEVLIKYDNIKIEIIGNWLWITGSTKAIKEELKKMNFKFSGKKKAWYYKSYTYKKRSSKKLTLNDIRDYYGTKVVKDENDNYQQTKKEVVA